MLERAVANNALFIRIFFWYNARSPIYIIISSGAFLETDVYCRAEPATTLHMKESNSAAPLLRLPPSNKALRRQLARLAKVAVEHIRSASGRDSEGQTRVSCYKDAELAEARDLHNRGHKFALPNKKPSEDASRTLTLHLKSPKHIALPPLTQIQPSKLGKNVMSTTSLQESVVAGQGQANASGKKGKTRDVSYILDQCGSTKSIVQPTTDASQLAFVTGQREKPTDVTAGYPQSLTELRAFRDRLEKSYRPDGVSEIMHSPDVILKYNIFKQVPDELYYKTSQFFADAMTLNQQRDLGLKSISDIVASKNKKKDWDLGVPSSRSDAIALLKWFDSMTGRLGSEGAGLEGEEKFDLVQTVYYICYKELARQVSVHCAERGSVIEKLWQAYSRLIKEMSEAHGKSLARSQQMHEEEIKMAEEKQRDGMLSLQQTCAELNASRSRMEDELRKLRLEMKEAENYFQSEKRGWEKEAERLNGKVSELDLAQYKYEELSKEFEQLDRKFKATKEEKDGLKKLVQEAQLNVVGKITKTCSDKISREVQARCDMIDCEAQYDDETTLVDMSTQTEAKGAKAKSGKLKKDLKSTGTLEIPPSAQTSGGVPRKKSSVRDFAAAPSPQIVAESLKERPVLTIEEVVSLEIAGAESKPDWMASIMSPYETAFPISENPVSVVEDKEAVACLQPNPVVSQSEEIIKGTMGKIEGKLEDENVGEKVDIGTEIKVPKAPEGKTPAVVSPRPKSKANLKPSQSPRQDPKIEAQPEKIVATPKIKTVDEGMNTDEIQQPVIKQSEMVQKPKLTIESVIVTPPPPPREEPVKAPAAKSPESLEKKPSLATASQNINNNKASSEKIPSRPHTPPEQKTDTVVTEAVKKELGEVKLTLSEKMKENARLKEELDREMRKLAGMTEENSRLDVENYRLKESIESIKERMVSLELEQGKLKETALTMEKGNGGEGQEKLLGQIKVLCETQEKLKIDIILKDPEASFIRDSNEIATPPPPGKEAGVDFASFSAVDAENREEESKGSPPRLEVPRSREALNEIKAKGTGGSISEKPVAFPGSPNHFKFVEFRLGRRKEFRKKSNARIIQELKENAMKQNKNVQPFPKKMLLKIISYFYNGMKNPSRKTPQGIGFVTYAYGELMNKYGLKNVADRKFLQILVASIVNKGLPRVRVFGKLLGLYDEYTNDELRCYLDMIELLHSLSATLKSEIYETDERHYAGYTIALECAKLYFEKQLPATEWTGLKTSLDSIRVADTRGKSPAGLVEIDLFAEQVITQYAKLSQKATDTIADLFIAADLDLNGVLTLDEFAMITLAFEPQIDAIHKTEKLFAEYADVTDSAVEYLSLDKLAALAVKNGLFMGASQTRLLNKPVTTTDFSAEFEFVKTVLASMRPLFKERLVCAGQDVSEWDAKMAEYEKRMQSNEYSQKSLWMTFRILSEYTQKVLRKTEMDRLFPPELGKFCPSYNA